MSTPDSGVALIEVPDDLWGIDDDRKAANEDRARKAGLEPCTICGRGVKPGNGWVIEVVNGGADIAHPGLGVDQNDPGYMGCWVLGPECGKKIPREFRLKWNGWDQEGAPA